VRAVFPLPFLPPFLVTGKKISSFPLLFPSQSEVVVNKDIESKTFPFLPPFFSAGSFEETPPSPPIDKKQQEERFFSFPLSETCRVKLWWSHLDEPPSSPSFLSGCRKKRRTPSISFFLPCGVGSMVDRFAEPPFFLPFFFPTSFKQEGKGQWTSSSLFSPSIRERECS